MNRRLFLNALVPAGGLSLAGARTSSDKPRAASGQASVESASAAAPSIGDFELVLRYHARRAERVLWTDPIPEKGLRGWQETPVTLNPSNTAVICMHTFNYGFPGDLDWSPSSPFLLWNRSVPAVPAMRRIIEERIAPAVTAAREAGLAVLYLTDRVIAERHQQYRPIKQQPAVPAPPRSPYRGWQAEREEQMYGKGWSECRQRMQPLREIAPPLRPGPRDLIAVSTLEVSTLLSERGIWNLLYTGFDTAGCILWAAGGVLEMNQLGYRCVVLRDCTAGGEIAETAQNGLLNKAALWTMETAALAYSADSQQLIKAMRGSPSAKQPLGANAQFRKG